MRRSLFAGIAAGLLAVALPAFSATQMEELAQTLHDNEFSAQVEKLIKNGRSAQALELATWGWSVTTGTRSSASCARWPWKRWAARKKARRN